MSGRHAGRAGSSNEGSPSKPASAFAAPRTVPLRRLPSLEDVEFDVKINDRVVPRQMVAGLPTIASKAGPFSIYVYNQNKHDIIVAFVIDDVTHVEAWLIGEDSWELKHFWKDGQKHKLAFANATMEDRTLPRGPPGSIKASFYTANFWQEREYDDGESSEEEMPAGNIEDAVAAHAMPVDQKHKFVSGGIVPKDRRKYTFRWEGRRLTHLGDKSLYFRPPEQIHDLLHPMETPAERRAREAAAAGGANPLPPRAPPETIVLDSDDEDDGAQGVGGAGGNPPPPPTFGVPLQQQRPTPDVPSGGAADTQSTHASQVPPLAPLHPTTTTTTPSSSSALGGAVKRKIKIKGVDDGEKTITSRSDIMLNVEISRAVAKVRYLLLDMDFGTPYRIFDVQNKRVFDRDDEETTLLRDVGDILLLERLDELAAAAAAGAGATTSTAGQKRARQDDATTEVEEDDDPVEVLDAPPATKKPKATPFWQLVRQYSDRDDVRKAIRGAFSSESEYRAWVPREGGALTPQRTDVKWEHLCIAIEAKGKQEPLKRAVGYLVVSEPMQM